MKWRLVIPPKVQDVLRTFPPQTKRYVRQSFLEIAVDPQRGKPLRDELTGLYSFRVKRFRIVYKIQKSLSTVRVVGVGPRKTIYDEVAARREET